MKRRGWFQFSLRSLLALLTILCVWLGWQVETARKQKAAIDSIASLGGGAKYIWEVEPKDGLQRVGSGRECPVPGWLRRMVGDDLFCSISTVWLGPNATDADLARLSGLNTARILSLDLGGSITDAGLASLPVMSNLKSLAIRSHRITNAGLQHLSKFPNLAYLTMIDVKTSDDGLRILAGNQNLKIIVNGRRFGDEAFASFKALLPECKVSPNERW